MYETLTIEWNIVFPLNVHPGHMKGKILLLWLLEMNSAVTTAKTWYLTFITWALSPSVAADSQSYFCLKCLCLHVCGTVFFFFAE
jgi:hypothetical protein